MHTINGKTPWEFSCEWYDTESISRSIAQKNLVLAEPHEKIPENIYSTKFAEWLTHEYRLAMRKGIELGLRSSEHSDSAVRRLVEAAEAYVKAQKAAVFDTCTKPGELLERAKVALELFDELAAAVADVKGGERRS